MIRLLGSILLFGFVTGESLPYRPPFSNPTVVPPVNPLNPVSPLHPYASGRNPLIPGYNNPYYNTGAAVPILTYSSDRGIDGTYSYSFSTADGKQAQESGFLKDAFIDNNGESQGTQVVEGSYAYISPEGTPIQVNYVADENGFRPSGVHIPADGKGVVPLTAAGLRDPQGVYDPLYNRYNPHNYRNPYYGQYNNPFNSRPYDSRYPYDPRYPYDQKFPLHNPYRAWGANKEVKEETKKVAAST